MITFELLNLEW